MKFFYDMMYSLDAGTSAVLSSSVLSSFLPSSRYFSSAVKANKPSLQTVNTSLPYVTSRLLTRKGDGIYCVYGHTCIVN